jgi:hypothetical protein
MLNAECCNLNVEISNDQNPKNIILEKKRILKMSFTFLNGIYLRNIKIGQNSS